MRAILLDSSGDITQRAHQLFSQLGIHVSVACSERELSSLLGPGTQSHFLVVNLTGDLSGWEITEQVRRAQFGGRTLILIDHPLDPGAAYLRQLPGAHCVRRPSSAEQLDAVIRELISPAPATRAPRSGSTSASTGDFFGLIGRSPQMLEIFGRIEKVAAGDANVCIYGESGTGKELIAFAIHQLSVRRRTGPFVTLDCTAVPEGLMESHLFGHVRGAFTGAVDHRDGVFSLAHTGTLFIDELCELRWPLQAKLLRVIQTREFLKVGGSKPVRSDIRLITATNKDPKNEVEKGTFREDLYYRVAVVMIKVPPLRERKQDIPLLVEHFLKRFSVVYRKPIRAVTPAAMDRIMGLPWPGNVRQLENFLEQAVVLADGDTLIERALFDDEASAGAAVPPLLLEAGLPLSEVERQYILRTLQHVRGNRTEAARILGLSVRCLQYKLKSYLEKETETQEGDVNLGPSERCQSL
jgi:DNA-binding NtrC family response regulator